MLLQSSLADSADSSWTVQVNKFSMAPLQPWASTYKPRRSRDAGLGANERTNWSMVRRV